MDERTHRRWQTIYHQVILTLLGVAAMGWLLWQIRRVVVPFALGSLLAWVLRPSVAWLRARRVPAVAALALPLVLFGGLLTILVAILIPTMISQVALATRALPDRVEGALPAIDPWARRLLGRPARALIEPEAIQMALQGTLGELAGGAGSVVEWLLAGAGDLLWALLTVGLTFVVAAYMIHDYDRVVAQVVDLIPLRTRPSLRRIASLVDASLMGFVRGELVLFGLATVAFSSGLLVLDVPFAALVGPVAALLYLVPYLGVVAGWGLALALAMLERPDLAVLIGVTTVFATFYGLDLLFITPRIIGGRVGLRPLVVLLGIIAAGQAFGIAGVLLAVPFLAVGRILLLEFLAWYRRSPAYLGDATGDTLGVPQPSASSPRERTP